MRSQKPTHGLLHGPGAWTGRHHGRGNLRAEGPQSGDTADHFFLSNFRILLLSIADMVLTSELPPQIIYFQTSSHHLLPSDRGGRRQEYPVLLTRTPSSLQCRHGTEAAPGSRQQAVLAAASSGHTASPALSLPFLTQSLLSLLRDNAEHN